MERFESDVIVIRWKELRGDIEATSKAFGVAPMAIYRYLEALGLAPTLPEGLEAS